MAHNIETIRHSTAHLTAAAVQKLYPNAQFGVGPTVDDGFYYDIDLDEQLGEQDLKKIEKEMQKLKQQNLEYEKDEMDIDDAITLFKKMGQTYKVELLRDLKKHGTTNAAEIYGNDEQQASTSQPLNLSTVSIYKTGTFIDLCRGPHVDSTKDIKQFKLLKLAGAYWRGDGKNKMMTRIYGTAFEKKTDLDAYLQMLEEAKKRDHKKLGPQLDLFTFNDLVGPGLPLWTPKGNTMRLLLDELIWSIRKKYRYERVEIPHITKKELFETSGHWDKFKDELFRITTREGHEFAMKPMNCPFHTQIYDRAKRSYRELPVRYSNTTMCYRDEQTGELSGLLRLRSFTQDDAHVFCRKSQIEQEFMVCWDVIDEFYGVFGFTLEPRLSLSDPNNMDAYLGDEKDWKKAEDILREIAKKRNAKAPEQPGEAAFYGPKIDFMSKDSIGREWQVATIQLDMNMPERFKLSCVNEKGEDERIVMLHCAVMGAIERFLAILIEHTAGDFPAWLAPVQVALLPVSNEKHTKHTQKLADEFLAQDVRAWIDDSEETIGKKVRNSEQQKIPYILVIGDKEMESNKLAVRARGSRDTEQMAVDDLIKKLQR